MDGCSHRKNFDELIEDGDLNGQSPVIDIPYIGPFFERRFHRLGFRSVNDLVKYFNRRTADDIFNGLTLMLQNPRRNTCVADEGSNEGPDSLYHVADFNVCAYASLRNLFRVLHERRNQYRALRFTRKPTFPDLPAAISRGSASAKNCSCLDYADCQTNRTCRWREDVCTPRLGPGFAGVATYPGQRSNGGDQQGLHYVNGWRTPGPTPHRRLPRPQPNRVQPNRANPPRRRSSRRTDSPIAHRLRDRGGPRSPSRRSRIPRQRD